MISGISSREDNVVLGATEAYKAHPIRQFGTSGIPVTLSTDDPVRVATTIGREYAIAARLGFTMEAILIATRENGGRAMQVD
jgi:adenosine deaminase